MYHVRSSFLYFQVEVQGPSGARLLAGGPLGLLTSSFTPFGCSGRGTHADIPKISPRCPQDIPKIFPRHIPDIPKIICFDHTFHYTTLQAIILSFFSGEPASRTDGVQEQPILVSKCLIWPFHTFTKERIWYQSIKFFSEYFPGWLYNMLSKTRFFTIFCKYFKLVENKILYKTSSQASKLR